MNDYILKPLAFILKKYKIFSLKKRSALFVLLQAILGFSFIFCSPTALADAIKIDTKEIKEIKNGRVDLWKRDGYTLLIKTPFFNTYAKNFTYDLSRQILRYDTHVVALTNDYYTQYKEFLGPSLFNCSTGEGNMLVVSTYDVDKNNTKDKIENILVLESDIYNTVQRMSINMPRLDGDVAQIMQPYCERYEFDAQHNIVRSKN